MKFRAYWLNMDGRVIPVESIHIMEVIRNPAEFNYTRKMIEAVYTDCSEPVGHEGKAREIIMLDLIKNFGWIRVRFKPKEDLWVVELHSLTKHIINRLKDLFRQSDVVGKSVYANLRITELFSADGKNSHNMVLNDLIIDANKI